MERLNLKRFKEKLNLSLRAATVYGMVAATPIPTIVDNYQAESTEEDQHEEAESVEGCRLTNQVWTGRATYYSRAGCLGCNPQRIMANGEVLNDSRRTLAFNRTRLNVRVLVENTQTNRRTVAVVTDRGGFESYGYIADLSVATRNSIGGGDITNVRITLCS
jgi:hypothetical protein